MPVVHDVIKGSICDEGGVRPGDTLISINGESIADVFDYRFQLCSDELEILMLSETDGEWVLEVEKDEDEDIGLVFKNDLMDEMKPCNNRCIFCFVDQLPNGVRESLLFKDDDLRLTFTNGNYVTLTNTGEDDILRVIRYRMSPVNVSVHSTDRNLRNMMLRNRKAGDIMEMMRRLAGGGIDVNCQIVLCKGINDGAHLDKTLEDLMSLGEYARSVSVVPAGLTGHRDGLFRLEPYDAGDARTVIDKLKVWQDKALERRGTRFVYPADEFFVLAGEEIPGYDYYDGFPQLENGVGMLALFRREFEEAVRRRLDEAGAVAPSSGGIQRSALPAAPFSREAGCDVGLGAGSHKPRRRKIYIATGFAAAEFIGECAATLNRFFSDSYGIIVETVPVKNIFFGGGVTVTGLLTGHDILEAFKGLEREEDAVICVSKNMLRYGTETLLDDFSLEMLRNQLKIDIIAVDNNGFDFIDKVLGS